MKFAGTGFRLLLYTSLGFLIAILLGGGLVLWLQQGDELPVNMAGVEYSTVADRQRLRWLLLINNFTTFGLTALIGLLITFKGQWATAAGLTGRIPRQRLFDSVLVFLVGLPLIALVAYLNLQIELPAWALRNEAATNAMLAGVLTFTGANELILALVTTAVVPGVCEELLFRGVLQRRILEDWLGGHAAIWIAAAIFSGIHLEFAGFLPRLLLGVLLGYSYRWTRSLWAPILLHIAFNGVQVLITYFNGEFQPDTEMEANPYLLWPIGLISLGIMLFLAVRTERIQRWPDPLP